MTKTIAQLRAEAVERLTKLNEHGYWEFPVHVALCGRDVPDVDEERAIIADLLTDDCGPCYSCAKLAEIVAENSQLRVKVDELANDGKAPEKVVTTESVGANDANAALDSREKLEADVRKNLAIMKLEGYVFDMIHGWLDRQAAITANELTSESDAPKPTESGEIDTSNGDMRDFDDSREQLEADANGYVMSWWQSDWVDCFDHADSMKSDIMRLLDRQANITSCEWNAKCESEECGFSELMDVANDLRDKNDELQVKVVDLTEQLESAHAKNRSLRQHIAKMQYGRHGWHVKGVELQREVDRLTRENISLARDLGECMAERDGLRRENVKLSDDEFYLRCTLVDMDGEVVG